MLAGFDSQKHRWELQRQSDDPNPASGADPPRMFEKIVAH
jgi:hypothetical protein